MIADDVVRLPAEKPYRVPRHRLETRPLGALADDGQPAARPAACGHGLVDPLVGNECRDHQVIIAALPFGRSRRVKVDVDGRLDHPAVAPITGAIRWRTVCEMATKCVTRLAVARSQRRSRESIRRARNRRTGRSDQLSR